MRRSGNGPHGATTRSISSGTVAGPHPYPAIVRDFQSVIGKEARRQCLEKTGKLPNEVIACVGGGSNAMGIFAGFVEDPTVKLTGVEAGGCGIETGKHAASICGGRPGVLHGCKTYLLQDGNGQVIETHSVSAGLDYPGVGPEHSFMADNGRAQYVAINDDEAIDAFDTLSRLEGIIPALESSHAVAQGIKNASNYTKDDVIIINISGRGDKDIGQRQTVQTAQWERQITWTEFRKYSGSAGMKNARRWSSSTVAVFPMKKAVRN